MYFPTLALAEQYARKPIAIASRVYGGRMGNGAEPTQEGYKFRGRGYIQLTGKDNYVAFGKSMGVLLFAIKLIIMKNINNKNTRSVIDDIPPSILILFLEPKFIVYLFGSFNKSINSKAVISIL